MVVSHLVKVGREYKLSARASSAVNHRIFSADLRKDNSHYWYQPETREFSAHMQYRAGETARA